MGLYHSPSPGSATLSRVAAGFCCSIPPLCCNLALAASAADGLSEAQNTSWRWLGDVSEGGRAPGEGEAVGAGMANREAERSIDGNCRAAESLSLLRHALHSASSDSRSLRTDPPREECRR
jgi:hypothetical protein